MAVEAIKTITQYGTFGEQYEWSWKERVAAPTLLLYSAYDVVPFRTTYLKKRRNDCVSCSAGEGSIHRDYLESGEMDYVKFCGVNTPTDCLPDSRRISVQDFIAKVQSMPLHFQLIDVREKQDYDMCHLKQSWNVPFSAIEKAMQHPKLFNFQKGRNDTNRQNPIWTLYDAINDETRPEMYFICRYGNDSQKAAHFFLRDFAPMCERTDPESSAVMDIKGGFHAWSQVDPTFPDY